MKILLASLVCLLTASALSAQSDDQNNRVIVSPSQNEMAEEKQLILTEENKEETIAVTPGETICIRFEDTEKCTTQSQPRGPFSKRITKYSFISASSEASLHLERKLLGSYLIKEAASSGVPLSPFGSEIPSDKRVEHEWIFKVAAAGQTALSFKRISYQVGCNGAPSPMYILAEPITFTIIAEDPATTTSY